MRMKLATGSVLMFFIAAACIPDAALGQKEIGINVGAALPIGDLGDVSETGFSVGGDYFFKFIDKLPNLRGGGRLAYNHFGDSNYPGSQWGANVYSGASSFEIMPSLRYIFTNDYSRVGYFAQLGMGIYVTMLEFNNFNNPDFKDKTELDFGVSLGGGVTYKLFDTVTVAAMPILHLTDNSFMSLNAGFIFGRREAELAASPNRYALRGK